MPREISDTTHPLHRGCPAPDLLADGLPPGSWESFHVYVGNHRRIRSRPSTADPGWTVDLTKKFYANLTLPTASGPILLFRTSRPAGSGALNLFPLGDTRAEPTTLRADQWLAGTTHDSLLLTPNELTDLQQDYLPSPAPSPGSAPPERPWEQ